MKLIYNGCSNKGGVYRIFNRKNHRVYYGSCKSFKTRAYKHKHALLLGKHGNRFLQSDFSKCGSEFFIFEVLQEVNDLNKRLEIEQRYLDKFFDSGKKCYNLRQKAISREGSFNSRKTVVSEETKRKISSSLKGRLLSEQHKNNISKALSGRSLSKEHVKKIKNANRGKRPSKVTNLAAIKSNQKSYKIVSPDGEIVSITNLSKFCRENNLHLSKMNQVANNKRNTYRGWTPYILNKMERRNELKQFSTSA